MIGTRTGQSVATLLPKTPSRSIALHRHELSSTEVQHAFSRHYVGIPTHPHTASEFLSETCIALLYRRPDP